MRQLLYSSSLELRPGQRLLWSLFDQRREEIGFRPARTGDGVYFWSAGRGWGVVELQGLTATLLVKGGELAISRLSLPGLAGTVTVNGQAKERDGNVILLGGRQTLLAGDRLVMGMDTYGDT